MFEFSLATGIIIMICVIMSVIGAFALGCMIMMVYYENKEKEEIQKKIEQQDQPKLTD